MEMIKFRTSMYNLYDCYHPFMVDPVEMDVFLYSLAKEIKMNVISKEYIKRDNPHSFVFDPKRLDYLEHGVSGILVMSESHISAHSFPQREGFINIVITSCKHFDHDGTLYWILKYSNCIKYISETMIF